MRRALLLMAVFLLLSGCARHEEGAPLPESPSPATASFRQISQEEAARMMAVDDGHIVLDVRRQDEYDEGHIPRAVCLPNEEIDTEPPELLPDKEQTILVYCRSGRRSKEAAQKLADMGYLNVYEFGGILDWTGEVVVPETAPPAGEPAELSFDSFDGGGPEYAVSIEDPDIIEYTTERHYSKDDHEELTGAGYTVSFTFYGVNPGETRLTVSARSPIADNFDALYSAAVDDGLNVTLTLLEVRDL